MTRPYSKVIRTTWGDEKFRRLSPLRPSGQALWIYLLTGPHCTVIPGLFPKMGIGTLADALQWPAPGVARAWQEIAAAGMAQCDWSTGMIWLPKAIEYNDPKSPNVVRSWGKVPLPQCELVTRALTSLWIYLSNKDNRAWADAFREVFGDTFPEAFGDDVGDPRARTGSRTGTGSNSPQPPASGGLKVIRQDRAEAKLIRNNNGGCPHDPMCETYSICVEHLAVAIAIRRDDIRRHAS